MIERRPIPISSDEIPFAITKVGIGNMKKILYGDECTIWRHQFNPLPIYTVFHIIRRIAMESACSKNHHYCLFGTYSDARAAFAKLPADIQKKGIPIYFSLNDSDVFNPNFESLIKMPAEIKARNNFNLFLKRYNDFIGAGNTWFKKQVKVSAVKVIPNTDRKQSDIAQKQFVIWNNIDLWAEMETHHCSILTQKFSESPFDEDLAQKFQWHYTTDASFPWQADPHSIPPEIRIWQWNMDECDAFVIKDFEILPFEKSLIRFEGVKSNLLTKEKERPIHPQWAFPRSTCVFEGFKTMTAPPRDENIVAKAKIMLPFMTEVRDRP